ncbi:pyridoxal phosphate-dependent decarboxylase family protein [Herbaspirillum sp. GCM10030257]|uniref:pyridoxal phosphate-dependent decarboxylase family protein n=1 Tax=Herbaspirillum sp. GCM10030257 TaxID=3273393 RepID=UPI00361DE8FE
MRELLAATAERAICYLEGVKTRSVAPNADAVARLALLDMSLSDEPSNPELLLQQLDEIGSPATMAMAGPRFFGFVIGGSLPATVAAGWLASAWDQNSSLYNVTPATAAIEQIALRWVLDVLKLPSDCGGAFVTGATVANFTALAAARHAVLAKVGWNVEADGLFGAPPITVIVGEEVHPTVLKALGMLGLGRQRIVTLPVDMHGRLRSETLPPISGPTIVCVQAGNVNTGAFDPFRQICKHAHDGDAWVHVDGAFGLWAAAAPSRFSLIEGIGDADSWATDGHKWLNVPYDNGMAFVRDSHALRAAMAITAEYLPTVSEYRNPADYTPELSRRARGVEVWAALRSLGRLGLTDLIERTCAYARRFAEALSFAGYQVLNEVVLNQVLVSFGTPEVTKRVIDDIQADGTCWCGGTVWQGHTAMRISVVSWATTDADVEKSIEVILQIAARHRPHTSPS